MSPLLVVPPVSVVDALSSDFAAFPVVEELLPPPQAVAPSNIVPAVSYTHLAVDADDIHAPCDHVFFIVVLTADQSDRTI